MDEIETNFFGHPFEYWAELERQAQNINAVHLLEECYKLRAKVSFYESRIVEMYKIMENKND
jgi:hypothetical protein